MFALLAPSVAGLHEWPANLSASFSAGRGCVPPGQCTPPSTTYSRVANGPVPGQQWNINGGFCGAFSVQHAALGAGAWLSQDLVRKANRDEPGEHNMHGDRTEGYEVMPSNVAYTAQHLKLAFEEWDYAQPSPQAPAFKRWLKSQLVQGRAIAFFPMCKGDGHKCYPGSCPNGGHVDHVEPMYGIFSNHPLDDPAVYDDDWIVHASDQDYQPYYRPLNSLEDTPDMEGNCAHAGSGFGKNEMYPCVDSSVTYALAVTGLAVGGETLPTSITTDGAVSEPNVRSGAPPKQLTAKVSVSGLTPLAQYTVYRYDGTDALPAGPPFDVGASHSTTFRALGATHSFTDPHPFPSSSAVYYVTVAGSAPVRAPSAPAIPSVPIAPGVPSLPLVSLGTGSGQHADVAAASSLWLGVGGRAIDTAYIYGNEAAIRTGIAQAGVPRADIFLTTKIPCGSYRSSKEKIDENLAQLGMSTADLTLIHFAHCYGGGSVADTWRALEDALEAGKSRAIGVSNFGVSDLKKLRQTAKVWPPAVNQASMSVGYHDDETISYCDGAGITYMAYSPLCGGSNGSSCQHGSVMSLPEVQTVAASHSVSSAQVALKWIVQQGRPLATAVAIEEYDREDLDLWSWGELTDEEMKTLTAVKL